MPDIPIAPPVVLEPRHSVAQLPRECGGTARRKRKSSFPRGKDEPRQIAVVKKAWIEYQKKERRFSKAFALALIALHNHLAKPGHGTFWTHLKELGIPRMTAYRLMQFHGWKAEKHRAEKKPRLPDDEERKLAWSKFIAGAIGVFSGFTGEERRKRFEELRQEIFAEESKESEAA
jgi:hypothetical protein